MQVCGVVVSDSTLVVTCAAVAAVVATAIPGGGAAFSAVATHRPFFVPNMA